MSVIHKKHSTAVGSTDPSKVHPSDWNDEHVNADGTPVTGMRVIGPFNLRFDTPDLLVTNSVPLEDLTADSALIDVWMEPITPWTGSGMDADDQMIIGLRGTGEDYEYQIRKKFLVNEAASSVPGVVASATADTDNGVVRLISAGTLIAAANFSGTPSAGEADIYALIADPA